MKEAKINWENFSFPKENGEYLLTIQTEPYTNEGNQTVFAKFNSVNINSPSYGFTYMDGSPIKDFIIAWAKKPEPCSEYFAP